MSTVTCCFCAGASAFTISPPLNTSLIASKIMRSPLPPASTTPALARAGRSFGVSFSESSACLQTSSIIIIGSFVEWSISLAFSADSLATVRIVPSVGFITLLYAPETPCSSDSTSSFAPISFLPASPFAKPLKISESITPEFPLAPLRSAEAVVLATTEQSVSSLRFSSSATEFVIVIDIFVPVSPSGTGNTLSSSTDFFLLDMLCAALMTASRSKPPFITIVFLLYCYRYPRTFSLSFRQRKRSQI